MRLGGHETFYLRPGWLTKGIFHLEERKLGRFADPEVADSLGVGRNMSKAIGWWLYATGLVERTSPKYVLELSELGKIIRRYDPFMTRLGTWWLIHTTAVTKRLDLSLRWFFANDRPYRFSRINLIDQLIQHLEQSNKNGVASLKTVQREVALVLNSYSVDIPKPFRDPEDNLGSPLQRLDLIHHTAATNHYERNRPDTIPPESLGICLSSHFENEFFESANKPTSSNSLNILKSASLIGQNFESTLELAEFGQKNLGKKKMEVLYLAGERVILVERLTPADWANLYYERLGLSNSGGDL